MGTFNEHPGYCLRMAMWNLAVDRGPNSASSLIQYTSNKISGSKRTRQINIRAGGHVLKSTNRAAAGPATEPEDRRGKGGSWKHSLVLATFYVQFMNDCCQVE